MDIAKLLESILSKEKIKTRLIDLVAYASDAGFYHLQPKAVVQPATEQEIQSLFKFSQEHQIPLTFRTAGTSLSGQSISDGILVDLSKRWTAVNIEEDGAQVRVQPGVIGAMVNVYLKKHHRKIGPDPASINSAMMGGILSNNSSGMCCGVSKNSYHTTKCIRFMLPNGKIYSTENKDDYARFNNECPGIYNEIMRLRNEITNEPALLNRIREKYKTKNTVGYSVNAFVDYEEPLDILAHLLIGAEGTLGFISEAVLNTVPDYPFKSTALLYFPDIYAACKGISPLTIAGAEAIELMDRASLRSVEHIAGLPALIKDLPAPAASLLVEFQSYTRDDLQAKVSHFFSRIQDLSLLYTPEFTEDPYEQAFLWKVRKGMFPSVGAVRARGTTVILEDITIPVVRLSDAILDLQQLFRKYEYHNAIIFGHAREGNIHFVITQAFDTPEEIDRYDRFIREVVVLVVEKYDGALKAEHGTGRNMAPFVETEWGPEIYRVMKSLKQCIDPHNLLNPGVIINENKQAHIQHLKKLPEVEEEVDKCMECGFCEHKCPSRNLTLTPRQRIVVRRALKMLNEAGETNQYKTLLGQYQYEGIDTCAVDGLCATACPVDINTGMLIKRLRRENHSDSANRFALILAKNFKTVSFAVKTALKTGNTINKLFGKNAMKRMTGGIKKIIPSMPVWSNQLKSSPALSKIRRKEQPGNPVRSVIYFPACISRVMGDVVNGSNSVMQTFANISAKAGIRFIIPNDMGGTCCGQPFSSKGFNRAYEHMANESVEKLWRWTNHGELPVVMDITSCTHTLHTSRSVLTDENKKRFDALTIIDSIDYVADHILPNVQVLQKKSTIVMHPVCSLQKMGLEQKFVSVARNFADKVEIPVHAGCCGMAGDRGFLFPEFTGSATQLESDDVKQSEFDGYYSSSKTCEIAMSDATGKNYQSILCLVDECI